MKNFWKSLSCLLPFCVLTACEPQRTREEGSGQEGDVHSVTTRMYVLCEGLYGMNNSSLYCRDMRTGETCQDIFRQQNGRGLGDTGNDMGIYGSKLYIVMNGSNTVEVLDARTAVSLKQIGMRDGNGIGRQPRSICFEAGKAYVCSFDNTVCRIDTASLEVEAVVEVGRDPDGICVSNGKLYVSNSGGLDYPLYDSTVSVVDLASFQEIKKIKVGGNPYTVAADSLGHVYVCTRGNYEGFNQKGRGPLAREQAFPDGKGNAGAKAGTEGYNFYRIDTRTDEVDKVFDIPVLNFRIQGHCAYLYHYDYGSGDSWISCLDLRSGNLMEGDFVTDGTEIQTPYAIGYDTYMDQVYVGDAGNFMVSGNVFGFPPGGGGCLLALRGVGLNPSSFAFWAEPDTSLAR